MLYEIYSHRFADIILNSDYEVKKEIEEVIKSITIEMINERYNLENRNRKSIGKSESKGKQSSINLIFKEKFLQLKWENEKNVFNDSSNDLTIDFWKRKIGIDVAFNHRSFIGGDLLRFQAAAEIKNIINVGVYICATKEFARYVSPKDYNSMVVFERVLWYLENFYQVLTSPILLIGLNE